jgi:hypothetical protein
MIFFTDLDQGYWIKIVVELTCGNKKRKNIYMCTYLQVEETYSGTCIHANPRETKIGRGGGSEFIFPGRKMVHSAAFWI